MLDFISSAHFIFLAPLFLFIPVSFMLGKTLLGSEVDIFEETLKERKRNHRKLVESLARLNEEKISLREKLTDAATLYAITKEMSNDMRFIELYGSIKSFLEDNCEFGKFKIALLEYENDEYSLGKIYEISRERRDYVEADSFFFDMTERLVKTKWYSFLERDKDLFNHGLQGGVKNALGIPLIIRRRVVAVIVVENIDPDDVDEYLIFASQITLQVERISLFASVEKLSITDGLTGTQLRRHFLETLEEEIGRAREHGLNLSFIMADLDHFKKCNDNFGHLVGDVVLKEVAAILKHNVREIDMVGRYGGEEFCVLLPEADKAGALAVAERIRKAVEAHTVRAYDETVRIAISMGVSSFPADSKNAEELIDNADRALYEAKRKGRNRVEAA